VVKIIVVVGFPIVNRIRGLPKKVPRQWYSCQYGIYSHGLPGIKRIDAKRFGQGWSCSESDK